MIKRLAKKDIVVKYLWFIAGLQISAAVELFMNFNFVDFPLRRFLPMLLAGFALGASSLVSLMLASEVEHVVKAGESMLGTTLERDRNQQMDHELNKTVPSIFRGSLKRKHKITAIFCSDGFLSILGIGLTILSKT